MGVGRQTLNKELLDAVLRKEPVRFKADDDGKIRVVKPRPPPPASMTFSITDKTVTAKKTVTLDLDDMIETDMDRAEAPAENPNKDIEGFGRF